LEDDIAFLLTLHQLLIHFHIVYGENRLCQSCTNTTLKNYQCK